MRRSQGLGALAMVILATPVAVWCLMGDRSEPDGYLRMFEPPTIGRGLELGIGMIAALLVLASAAVAVQAWRARLLDRTHRRAASPLVIAGLFIAVGARIVTSATYGANIGGGGVLLMAPLVLPPLLLLGARRWWRLVRAHQQLLKEPG